MNTLIRRHTSSVSRASVGVHQTVSRHKHILPTATLQDSVSQVYLWSSENAMMKLRRPQIRLKKPAGSRGPRTMHDSSAYPIAPKHIGICMELSSFWLCLESRSGCVWHPQRSSQHSCVEWSVRRDEAGQGPRECMLITRL